MKTLLALLKGNADRWPDRPALLSVSSSPVSHRDLFVDVGRIGAGLAAQGIARTDRVAIVLANGPDAALAFLGAACAATAAPLNPGYSNDELKFYMSDLRARLVITDQPAGGAAVTAAAELAIPVVGLPHLRTHEPAGDDVSPAQQHDIALVLHTSGTTSRPKIVPLTHLNLVASAHGIAQSLQLTPRDRSLNIMPLFHVHGLVGAVLASLAAGASVVCTPGFSAANIKDWVDAFGPTWYTGVPTMHQAILARGEPQASSLRFIRSCSSALPPTLLTELQQKFRVPVIEAYGMTEAAHQVASNPLQPRLCKPGSVGVATGTEIAVMDETGVVQESGAIGEIVIKGPGVTRGYESPPEASGKAFAGGWFRTGDQGYVDAEGYVFLTGRLKEIINRGGEKLSPREVDELLLQHAAVAQAVAFSVPHPTLGEDLAAAVVLREGLSVTEEELRGFALERLAGFKVPTRIVIVDAIPKGPTGKLQRIGLAEKLAGQLKPAFMAPRDEIESVIADIWQEVLGLAQTGVHDNFFAQGGDSLRAARVVARVNEIFHTERSITSVFHHPTVEQYAGHVRQTSRADRIAAIVATMRELQGLTDVEVERLLEGEKRPTAG